MDVSCRYLGPLCGRSCRWSNARNPPGNKAKPPGERLPVVMPEAAFDTTSRRMRPLARRAPGADGHPRAPGPESRRAARRAAPSLPHGRALFSGINRSTVGGWRHHKARTSTDGAPARGTARPAVARDCRGPLWLEAAQQAFTTEPSSMPRNPTIGPGSAAQKSVGAPPSCLRLATKSSSASLWPSSIGGGSNSARIAL